MYLAVPFSTPALSMDFRHLLVLIKSTGAGALSASSATHRDTHKHTSTKRDSLFPRGSALDATLLRAGTLSPPSLSAPTKTNARVQMGRERTRQPRLARKRGPGGVCLHGDGGHTGHKRERHDRGEGRAHGNCVCCGSQIRLKKFRNHP